MPYSGGKQRVAAQIAALLPAHERERLARRARWLRERIAVANHEGRDSSLDIAELAALRWVLRIVDADWDLALEMVQRPADAAPGHEEDYE